MSDTATLSTWERLKQWGMGKATAVANQYPEATAWVARQVGQGDKVDLIKFLYEEDKDLPAKIAAIRQDPGMSQMFDTVMAATQKEIGEKIPAAWRSAAESAGIPVAELEKRIKENGAQKIAYAVTASVQEEIKSSYWYGGRAIGDVWQETKQKAWKEPEKTFFEDPLGWIGTMISNVIGMVKGLWQSANRSELEERGKAYATQDVAARSEEIVGKVGHRLAVEMDMPSSFAAEIMLGAYERIHKEANPSFTLSDKEKGALRTKYVAQLETAKKNAAKPITTPAPAAPVVTTVTAAREQSQGIPELGLTGGDAVAPAISPAPSGSKPVVVPPAPASTTATGDSTPEFDYPEFLTADLEKYRYDAGFWKQEVLGHEIKMGGLGLTLSAIASGSEERLTGVIKSFFPDAVFYHDKGNNLIIDIEGDKFYWNRPGMSGQDVAGFTMEAMKFAPVGRIGAIAAAGKGFIGRTLAYTGVGAAWGVATDSAASVVAGQPDVDVGQAIMGGIYMGALPLGGKLLQAIPTEKLGAMGKKVMRGLALSRKEQEILDQAGIKAIDLERAATPWALSLQQRAAAAGVAGAGTTAVGALPAAAGDPVPHANVDPSTPVRPGKTPSVAHHPADEMSLPLMP